MIILLQRFIINHNDFTMVTHEKHMLLLIHANANTLLIIVLLNYSVMQLQFLSFHILFVLFSDNVSYHGLKLKWGKSFSYYIFLLFCGEYIL